MTSLTARGWLRASGCPRTRIRDNDPLSARAQTEWQETVLRGPVETRTELRATMSLTATEFRIHASLDASESDQIASRREWQKAIPRDLV